jgi:hypothetical protein
MITKLEDLRAYISFKTSGIHWPPIFNIPVSPIQRYGTCIVVGSRSVSRSASKWWAGSATLPIAEIPKKLHKRKNGDDNVIPVSVSRGVADSPHRWVGESPTPPLGESGSRLLSSSVSRVVGDYGELRSRHSKVLNFVSIFRILNG